MSTQASAIQTEEAPRIEESPSPETSHSADDAPAPDILIIDDELEGVGLLKRSLLREGFSVNVASGAHEALDRIAHQSPKVILLDLMMPGLDGASFLKLLRQHRSPGALPVIVVSASAERDDLFRCLDEGANDYVTKPVDYPALLKRVRVQLMVAESFRTLEDSEQRLVSAFTGVPDAGWGLNAFADLIETSTEFRRIFGCPPGGLTLETWLEGMLEGDRNALRKAINAVRSGEEPDFERRVRFRRADDELGWALVRGHAEADPNGSGLRVTGDVIDITGERGIDRVAGVGSARACAKRLETLAAASKRVPCALFDIDDFNEILGPHAVLASEEALLLYGQNMRRAVRDMGEVFRISDDQFVVVGAEGIPDAKFRALVSEIAVGESMGIQTTGRWVQRISSCAGVVPAAAFADAPEHMFFRAKIALKAAKTAGRGKVRAYSEELAKEALRRPILAERLRRALDERSISVDLQPIVDLQTREWIGAEALARWRDGQLGAVSPLEFAACADWIGESLRLTEIVADQAFSMMPKSAGKPRLPLVSINITGASSVDPELAPLIEELADKHRISLDRVVLEVTENDLISDLDASVQALSGLIEKGARLAIDDFGSGYSSLTYLCRLPASWLKLDTVLLHTAEQEADARALLSSISRTAKHLGKTVVVEGVENATHVEIAQAIGATHAQGFHFSRPMSAARFLKEWKTNGIGE